VCKAWITISKLSILSVTFHTDQKRGSSRSPDTVSQGGYATNFDTGVGGGGIRGVEGQIMSHVFKPLVTRFVDSAKEIKTPDNLVIFFTSPLDDHLYPYRIFRGCTAKCASS
jgi:hypothetical protein